MVRTDSIIYRDKFQWMEWLIFPEDLSNQMHKEMVLVKDQINQNFKLQQLKHLLLNLLQWDKAHK